MIVEGELSFDESRVLCGNCNCEALEYRLTEPAPNREDVVRHIAMCKNCGAEVITGYTRNVTG